MTMLYDDFDAKARMDGQDVFIDFLSEKTEILHNLNPVYEMREYQKEAMGRFCFYFEQYQQKKKPYHLMFNMATGSGKTLIMAANILYLYQQGYRNFVFFTRLGHIIQKTKTNFLDSTSKKYLFGESIIIEGKEVEVKEVFSFDGVNDENINIIFSTTAMMHSLLNSPCENALTIEDLAANKIVLIADEAHNLSAETAKKINTTEYDEQRNWENTVLRMLNSNPENMLLEFTATARLEDDYPEIMKKYKNKAIYRYDLKKYREDGFSKDVTTLQINAPVIERVLSAVVISQYRQKIAEKYKIFLKPVVMFKSNRVSSTTKIEKNWTNPQVVLSGEFEKLFHKTITNLEESNLNGLKAINSVTLQKAFRFFEQEKISLSGLVAEIKNDFSPDKCLSVDNNNDTEKKQILLNTLENSSNEIRAVFATEKLNEGWDVLNLFDIVRLYNSRDARANKPGKTTVQEAQLIGRGARYWPFKLNNFTDLHRRKFDNDTNNELRILEQLHYHSLTNPQYIQELEAVLVREGIIPAKTVKREIKIKDDFKKSPIWQQGRIFLNSRRENDGKCVFSLSDAKAEFNFLDEKNIFELPTRHAVEKGIFSDEKKQVKAERPQIKPFYITHFGDHVVRAALAKTPHGRFNALKKIFGNLSSIKEFIQDEKYLGGVQIRVKGTAEALNNLLQSEKLAIAYFVVSKVLDAARKEKKAYYGTQEFLPRRIQEIFSDNKVLQLDANSPRAQQTRNFDFDDKEWFVQNEIWGTSEEKAFLLFIDGEITKLSTKYQDIALFRNEQFFKIYSFNDGKPFYPDFVLFLTEQETKKEIVYQIFIEPKGDGFLDSQDRFTDSKEGWKEQMLLEIKNKHKVDLILENKDFRLFGLPFFNAGETNSELRERFEQAFLDQLFDK